jgi:hypothetical protein
MSDQDQISPEKTLEAAPGPAPVEGVPAQPEEPQSIE